MPTAIKVDYIPATNTKPARLKASTMAARSRFAIISYYTDVSDTEDQRYLAALQELLTQLHWGDADSWVEGHTASGRVYVQGVK